jgi:hypothetical protein
MVGELEGVGLGFGEFLGRGVEGVEEWLRETEERGASGKETGRREQSVGRRGAVVQEG